MPGTRGNDGAALFDDGPEVVLVVGLIARQRDRDKEVVLIVAYKVENQRVLFLGVLSEAAAQLLNKDNRRLRPAEHDDLVDGWNIDALIEDVHREDILDLPRFKLCNGGIALRIRIGTAKRERTISQSIELLGKGLGLIITVAEDQAAAMLFINRVLLDFLRNVLHAFARR